MQHSKVLNLTQTVLDNGDLLIDIHDAFGFHTLSTWTNRFFYLCDNVSRKASIYDGFTVVILKDLPIAQSVQWQRRPDGTAYLVLTESNIEASGTPVTKISGGKDWEAHNLSMVVKADFIPSWKMHVAMMSAILINEDLVAKYVGRSPMRGLSYHHITDMNQLRVYVAEMVFKHGYADVFATIDKRVFTLRLDSFDALKINDGADYYVTDKDWSHFNRFVDFKIISETARLIELSTLSPMVIVPMRPYVDRISKQTVMAVIDQHRFFKRTEMVNVVNTDGVYYQIMAGNLKHHKD